MLKEYFLSSSFYNDIATIVVGYNHKDYDIMYMPSLHLYGRFHLRDVEYDEKKELEVMYTEKFSCYL